MVTAAMTVRGGPVELGSLSAASRFRCPPDPRLILSASGQQPNSAGVRDRCSASHAPTAPLY